MDSLQAFAIIAFTSISSVVGGWGLHYAWMRLKSELQRTKSRILQDMNPELDRWLEYVKWKCERSEKNISFGLSFMVAGAVVLGLTGSVMGATGFEYPSVFASPLEFLLTFVIGIGVAFIAVGFPWVLMSLKQTGFYENLTDLIAQGEIRDIQSLSQELKKSWKKNEGVSREEPD